MRNLTVNGKSLDVTQFCGGSNIGKFLMQAFQAKTEDGSFADFTMDDAYTAEFVVKNAKGETISVDGIAAADAIIENFASYFDGAVDRKVSEELEGSRITDLHRQIEDSLRDVLAKLEYNHHNGELDRA